MVVCFTLLHSMPSHGICLSTCDAISAAMMMMMKKKKKKTILAQHQVTRKEEEEMNEPHHIVRLSKTHVALFKDACQSTMVPKQLVTIVN